MKHIPRLIRQIIIITPILWLLELFQNRLYHSATGKWGWVYPGSPHGWFSFETLGNWALAVVVMYLLYRIWFIPRYSRLLTRIFIIGIIGVFLEYTSGLLFHHLTDSYFFIWEHSRFRYIDFIALPMWWVNAAVYHFMSLGLVNLHR